MPRRFLSQAERERLSQFPTDVSENDQIVYFSLTTADKEAIFEQRTPHTQLGFALLLCVLRYLGFFPTELGQVPEGVVRYVAQQLDISPENLTPYLERSENRWEDLGPVMKHLDFSRMTVEDRAKLVRWLGDRALENERPSGLLQLACERLYQQHLVRPGITTLEELISDARQQAQRKTVEILVDPLPSDQRRRLTALLKPMKEGGITPLTWIRRSARGHSDTDILDTLAKLDYVRQWPITEWDVSELSPGRLKFLAQVARYTSNQGLQQKKPDYRDAILLAFLRWAHEKLIDELIDLFDRCLAEALRKSQRELKEHHLAHLAQVEQVVTYFQTILAVVLDEGIPDEAVRSTIYDQVTSAHLEATLVETEQLRIDGRALTHLDFFNRRYSYFRRFVPAFLGALTFESQSEDDDLRAAIEVLQDLNQQGGNLPATLTEAPTDFVPARWQTRVFNRAGMIQRRDYELCVLSTLREGLRSGSVGVVGSGRYAALESYLIAEDCWPDLRNTYCELVGMPAEGTGHLAHKQVELEDHLARLDEQLPHAEHVRLEGGRLILSPLTKEAGEEEGEADTPLAEAIRALLPIVQCGELLAEVDTWTRFTAQLTHAGGATGRWPNLAQHLYAVILAQACNIELSRMAELADLAYDKLLWCANWYLREETLQAATEVLVNFQYQQDLSRYWGDGSFSSSDGQRFVVATKSSQAAPLPRYFGYGRGLTFLTWTSDQLSQYAIRITPPTIRESTYILDAILENETDLPLQEHSADTAGYTDLMFALFDLLGLQFSPRLHDLGRHNLYCLSPEVTYQHITSLISRPLQQKLLEDNWDDLLRVAASLKFRWVTASTLISKLQAGPHKLTHLLQEYGRLVRTIFIAHYLVDEPYRRRILRQLNKGEAVHRLRRFLFFDNQGQLRKRYHEDFVNQAGCLNLLSNAIIVWNTVYMQAALDELVKREFPVREDDLAHLSPIRFRHINPYGKFQFELISDLTPTGLRPLRSD